MKAHQLFLLTFWLNNVYLVLSAKWDIDFSPLKEYYNLYNIVPSPYFKEEDVPNIHSALMNEKPDEIKIIEILSRLTSQDRQLLTREYQRAYNTRFVNDLRNKLTGKLEETMVAIMTPLKQFMAQEVNDAIYGVRSDETALVDTLCLLNTTMLKDVRDLYKIFYQTNLEYEIKTNMAGSFGKLLISCIHNMKFSSVPTENYVFQINHGFTDDDLISYFAQTSFEALHDFAAKHKALYGKKIEDIIEEYSSGDFKRGLTAIFNYAQSEELYFVIRFHESLEKNVVDHRSLIRLILMKKNVSYEDIRDAYMDKYHKDIDEVLSNKIPTGNYRKLIQALFIRM